MQVKLDVRAADGAARAAAAARAASDKLGGGIYVVSGDEPLLAAEVGDALRASLKQSGVVERLVEVPDRSFDWKGWLAGGATGSLFSDKRLMDLRLVTGKPGTEGSKAIQAWCQSPPADVVLLVTLPRADRAMQSSSWFGALDEAGVIVVIPELYRADLPGWISQRLRAQGLTATPDALAWMCDQCEGNLMAAHQEIMKLALHSAHKEEALTVEDLRAQISDVARFNSFSLGESLLAGDAARALRILRGLKAEAEPLPLVLWAVTEDLRMVARAQQLLESGRTVDAALREARIPRHRERWIAAAVRRAHPAKTWRALRQAAEVDTMAKGLKADDPWVALERLAMDYA